MNYLKKLNIASIIYLNALILTMGFISIHANLPLYARELGITTANIGAIISANPLASILFTLPFAVISDKISRKATIFAGLIFFLLLSFILLFAKTPLWFTIAKALEGMAMSAFLPAATAYISDISSRNETAKNIAKLTAIINIGFLISPVISAFITNFYGIRAVFIFIAATAILNLLLSVFIFTNKERNIQKTENTSNENLSSILNRKAAITIGILALSLGYAHGLIDAIWSIYLQDCGAKVWLINISYTIYAIPIVLISTYIGKWCDKNQNHSSPIIFGGLLFCLSQLSYAFVPIPIALAFLSSIEGLGYGIFYPTSNTAMVKAVNENYKGRALGTYNFLRMAGNFAGAFFSARLYTKSSVLPFLISSGFMFVSSMIAGVSVIEPEKETIPDIEPALET